MDVEADDSQIDYDRKRFKGEQNHKETHIQRIHNHSPFFVYNVSLSQHEMRTERMICLADQHD
jgi:hypothetical protein